MTTKRNVKVQSGTVRLDGVLAMPDEARGVVLFAHGSGSSRHSPRNKQVADTLRGATLATLLFDLLTTEEELIDRATRELRFHIPLLANRLIGAVDWVASREDAGALPIGLFGASTGAAAALIAASHRPDQVRAVVSRGGRPDLAGEALPEVRCPTLLIVGARDEEVLAMNREAAAQLRCDNALEVVPGATHLFEEPGALEHVAALARDWFAERLVSP